MDVKRLILTRLLPKTGQTVEYVPYDDGRLELGWWKRQTLLNNRTRFIALTLSGDDVVIDNATGLMWAADRDAAGCYNGNQENFANAVSWGLSLTFGGLYGWRLPNINELFSLRDRDTYNPMIDDNYFTCYNDWYGTSTTNPKYPGQWQCISFAAGGVTDYTKGTVQYLRACRNIG